MEIPRKVHRHGTQLIKIKQPTIKKKKKKKKKKQNEERQWNCNTNIILEWSNTDSGENVEG